MRAILTESAPRPVGPYSQALVHGDLVFASGQIPLDPATGRLVGGEIEAQTERVLQNLRAVLEAAGTGWDRVLRTTLYLVDMADFAVVNRIYGEALGSARPARATVAVAALPRGARIEIDAVALAGTR